MTEIEEIRKRIETIEAQVGIRPKPWGKVAPKKVATKKAPAKKR